MKYVTGEKISRTFVILLVARIVPKWNVLDPE